MQPVFDYHYHPETGEHMGSTPAKLDPLESKKAGRDVYAEPPAHATRAKPPEVKKDEAAVFDEATGAWQATLDYRATKLWDTATGQPVQITEIGVTPDETMTELEPLPYARWAETKKWVQDVEIWKHEVVRPERNFRLAACDYIMMPDYPLANKAPWETYRQELRDLPATLTAIIDPIPWPTPPV